MPRRLNDNPDVLTLPPHDVAAAESLRLYLVSCSNEEVCRHCTETLHYINALTGRGFSSEALLSYRQALLEILVELRVRGFEVDYDGTIYHADLFHPVPAAFAAARKRQIQRLGQLHPDLLGHLCSKTLLSAAKTATRTSKHMH